MNVAYMIYGFFAWGLLSTALCVFMIFLTPAIPFLSARLSKGKSVMLVIHKGNRVSFTTGTYDAGCFKTKSYGLFDETANSMYYAFRTPLYFVPEYFSHTLPHQFPMAIQGLKKGGFHFLNFLDYFRLSKEHVEEKLKMPNGETIRMGDLQHMFPCIDDPHIREKEKANEYLIARGLSGVKDWKKYLIYLLIGGVVAFIIWKLFLGGKSEQAVNVICQYPDIVNSGVRAVSNLSI